LSVDGIVDCKSGECILSYHLGLTNTPIAQPLQDRLGIPTVIDNDVRAMALAEHWFGAAKDVSEALVIEIDEGIGLAVLSGSNIGRGAHHRAGEFGHTVIW